MRVRTGSSGDDESCAPKVVVRNTHLHDPGSRAYAKAAGKRLGRPRGTLGKSMLDGKKEEIKTLLALRVSKASIAKITGADRETLYHFLRSQCLI